MYIESGGNTWAEERQKEEPRPIDAHSVYSYDPIHACSTLACGLACLDWKRERVRREGEEESKQWSSSNCIRDGKALTKSLPP